MEDADIPMADPSIWHPITNKADLAYLGKLGEEVCECGGRLFRCIIQGILEFDPDSKNTNLYELENEIADIEAMLAHIRERFPMNESRIRARMVAKFNYKAPWFAVLKAED